RAVSWSVFPTFDFVALTTASAASVSAVLAGASGSETTIGTPRSPAPRNGGGERGWAPRGERGPRRSVGVEDHDRHPEVAAATQWREQRDLRHQRDAERLGGEVSSA